MNEYFRQCNAKIHKIRFDEDRHTFSTVYRATATKQLDREHLIQNISPNGATYQTKRGVNLYKSLPRQRPKNEISPQRKVSKKAILPKLMQVAEDGTIDLSLPQIGK